MTETTTMTEAAIPAIEKTLELAAPRDLVWRAITEPDQLAQWFPERAELDLAPGGDGAFEWQEHGRFAVRVVAIEPQTYFAWRWANAPGASIDAAAEKTLVEWWLADSRGGGTILRLRESGFTRPSHRDGNDEGWGEELGELVALLAR